MAQTKIERYGLEDRILALSGEGKRQTEIAKIVTQEAAGEYEISQSMVSRFLQGVRKERSEQTRQVVHDFIRATVPKDMEALNEVQAWLISQFRSLADISFEKVQEALGQSITQEFYIKVTSIFPAQVHDLRTRAELGMKIVRIVDTKLKYAGILEDPDGQSGYGTDPVDLDEFRTERKGSEREAAVR